VSARTGEDAVSRGILATMLRTCNFGGVKDRNDLVA
jgi:hypothetical protein